MFNIQSPTFSSSSKMELSNKLSPVFRNKRIASGQQLSSNNGTHWNRTNSCKKLEEVCNEKYRKRSHNSQQRVYRSKINFTHNLIPSTTNQHILEELGAIKNEYTTLKTAYQDLIDCKVKNDDETRKFKVEIGGLKEENERIRRENEKLRNKISFLEAEVDRIKKQSMKLIEIQQFKALKLEENLVQKQKAISNLIESLKVDSSSANIATTETQPQQPSAVPQISHQHIESLTFSQDKTLTNSEFISISLTSMMENESQFRHELSTRRNLGILTGVSQNQNCGGGNNISIIEHMGVDKDLKVEAAPIEGTASANGKENQQSTKPDNFKKFRKEISKKIEVNVEDRVLPQKNSNTGHGLDRKNSKSHKSSKTKLKRDDESSEHRSSKKKMSSK